MTEEDARPTQALLIGAAVGGVVWLGLWIVVTLVSAFS